MIKDKFGNPIYQDRDIVDLIYKGLSISDIIVDNSQTVAKFEEHSGIALNKFNPAIEVISVEDYDRLCQSQWFIPDSYKNIDIEEYLVHKCPEENYQRLVEELQEYRDRNLLSLLKVLKYLVDTLREHGILWGVGRGSSVASYVLYLLEVHRIDSVKYNLDWREFLR